MKLNQVSKKNRRNSPLREELNEEGEGGAEETWAGVAEGREGWPLRKPRRKACRAPLSQKNTGPAGRRGC